MDLEHTKLNKLSNSEIVAHMRKLNYEQYKRLVRMHLSFELDLNTDEFDLPCQDIEYEDKGKLKKWNRVLIKKKHMGGTAASCGSTITSKNDCQSPRSDYNSTEYFQQQIDQGFLFHLNEMKQFLLLDKNITQEGIFRKTGSISRQNELRLKIQQDKPLDLEDAGFTAHDCATVFKGYLADLSEPLLTDAHYPAHLQIAPLCLTPKIKNSNIPDNIQREEHLLHSVQLLVLLLPDDNRLLLKHVIEVLSAVIVHKSVNKMTPENLATLFTPHLICPRKLPPEALHYISKKMSSIVCYMIVKGLEIFEVPAKLSTDIRAYLVERKRKKTMSPEQTLDDSISDTSTVNTVYTFVDREKTAAAHNTNTTDTELAQLYAHIQTLPESSKKRRLIKQFNKQNGQGTPLQLLVMNRLKNSEATRSAKSIGDSIKKHIFHKGITLRTPKRQTAALPEDVQTPNFSNPKNSKLRILFESPDYVSVSTQIQPISTSSSSTSLLTPILQTPSIIDNEINKNLKKSISSTSIYSTPIRQFHHAHHNVHKIKHSTIINQKELTSVHRSCSSSSLSGSSPCNTNAFITQQIQQSKSISDSVRQQISSNLHSNSSCSSSSNSLLNLIECSLSDREKANSHTSFINLDSTIKTQISNYSKFNTIGHSNFDEKNDENTRIEHIHIDEENIDMNCEDNDEYCYNHNHYKFKRSTRNQKVSDDKENKNGKSRYKSEPNLSSFYKDNTNYSNINFIEDGSITDEKIKNKNNGKSFTNKLIKGVSLGNIKLLSFARTMDTKKNIAKSKFINEAQEQQLNYEKCNKAILYSSDEISNDDSQNELVSSLSIGCGEINEKSNNKNVDVMHANEDVMAQSHNRCCPIPSNLSLRRSAHLITSTPSLMHGRRSMSPITKSTQRMSKAMQESIMTPRSRKPVMVLNTNTVHVTERNQTINENVLTHFEEEYGDEHELRQHQLVFRKKNITSFKDYIDVLPHEHLTQVNQSFLLHKKESRSKNCDSPCTSSDDTTKVLCVENELTNNFKEYLLSRSVLTASPVDSSFASQPDDFASSLSTTQDIEELEESQLSSSLLYCLDGNQPHILETKNLSSTNNCNQVNNDLKLALKSKNCVHGTGEESSISCVISATKNVADDNRRYNYLDTNPFVIMNNARKRAATFDNVKETSSTKIPPLHDKISSKEKENCNNSHVKSYILSKKNCMDEYPGETSF